MVLTKEYRICMPLTTEEYRIGQLYMIARHSHEQSDNEGGVEVVQNVEWEDPEYGKGQYTEKRIHLSTKLPYWIQSIVPRIFYIIEKAWNYYPFTITEYTCSFLPKFQISIKTRFEDNNGSSENVLGLSPIEVLQREVDDIDIAYDEISAKHYKEEEDPKFFQSKLTGRGPLIEGWRETAQPIMCSYKLVHASFEVWGLQTRVEDFIHRCIRDILLLAHRQAFAWIDEWYNMTLEDVREYEQKMQAETNEKVRIMDETDEKPLTPISSAASVPSSPVAKSAAWSWFSWS
ncbi:cytoplasmic phosphatidylinositol transfer protein 1 [Colletes latitarsis]|uniref:cytoplasmic phosphatidylinositol transfer protein 1 n=1 Tax=Colletes latitarsis TaxID=2605962 RepID=UPI004036E872